MQARLLFTAALLTITLRAFAGGPADPYREAVNLYEHGLYGRAASLLETVPHNEMSDGYALLCAIKLKEADIDERVLSYERSWHRSVLSDKINFEYGLWLFDNGRYLDSAERFDSVYKQGIDQSLYPELAFKHGYSLFSLTRYPEARPLFLEVEELPMSDYKGPARYALGYMAYTDKDFAEAERWFKLAASDPRLSDISAFYLVDCRFMQKDYDYTIERGTAIYDSEPQKRQAHLARIISESYLVKGDKAKAKEYYTAALPQVRTRADLFYSGSVLYNVGDYKAAIASFTRMEDRTDSIGQIANYQLADSYLATGNKVAAMESFQEASKVFWNMSMQEDAMFNYAKLAFDLNKDSAPFNRYIARYNTSHRGDEIYGYMALTMLYDHDYAGAVEAYDKIDELTPDQHNNYVKAYYLRGQQLIEKGAWTDAIPCLRTAAYYLPKQDPLGQMARYWQAEALYRKGQYDESAQIFASLYNISALPGTTEGALIPYNTAYSHMSAGEYPQAIRWFDIYISEKDTTCRRDALVRRGDCYFAGRDYAGGIDAYRAAIKEISVREDIYPYSRLALCYGLSGDKYAKADVLAYVLHATPETPGYFDGLYDLGRANMDISDNAKAKEAFEIMRDDAKDPETRARALIGLGMVNRNTTRYNEALDCYKEVVSLLPGSQSAEDALLAIESIYQTVGTPEKYLEYIEGNNLAAGKTDSDRDDLYFNTAEQVFLSGNWLQAASSLQKYLDTYPKGAHTTAALFYLAETFSALDNKEKAIDYYEKVATLPDAGSFAESSLLRVASLSYSLDRYQRAYDAYSELKSRAVLDANRREAAFGMMRSAYNLRSWEAAIAACAEVSAMGSISAAEARECDYIKAKSLMASSRRAEALDVYRKLAAAPATPEGAEACYILIQDAYDRADYDGVQTSVFDFSSKAGGQNYWLARAYITLADTFVQIDKKAQARATLESIRDGYTASGPSDDVPSLVSARLSKLD